MLIEKPKRFFIYCNKVYFTYKTKYCSGKHPTNQTEMHGWDEYAVFIGFDFHKCLGKDYYYYDGHTVTQYFFFGLTLGHYFSYTWGEKT